MKKFRLIILIVVMFNISFSRLYSQQEDEFSDFDEDFSEESSEDKDNFLDSDESFNPFVQLYKNLTGNINIKYNYFFKEMKPEQEPFTQEEKDNAEAREKKHFVETILSFSNFIGQDSWKIAFAGWAEIGNEEDRYKGTTQWMQDKEKESRYFELNELYLSLFFNNFDLTLGKKTFENSISKLYSPADRYSPTDLHDPFNPKKFGIWQSGLDIYIYNLTLSGYIFPVYQLKKSPGPKSRWIETTSDESVIDSDSPEINKKNICYFSRIKGTIIGWDFFISYYHGFNANDVFKGTETPPVPPATEPTYVIDDKETNKVYNIGGGFSTTFGKLAIHAEGLYNYTYNSKDDNYISYVTGFTYGIDDFAKKILLDKIDITIEYAREKIIKEMDAGDDYIFSSDRLRLGKNDLIVFILIKINEDFNIKYLSHYEFKENGKFHRGEFEIKLIDSLKLFIIGEFFNGDENSYHGKWNNNDRVISSIEYSF